MLRVQQDDAQAFAEIVSDYQLRLEQFLFQRIGDRTMAEDLAQDVFVRVYRARKRYVANAAFTTWLFTIAANVARNEIRRQSRRPHIVGSIHGNSMRETLVATATPAEELINAETQAVFHETSQRVRIAMARLSDRQRTAVQQFCLEGHSHRQVGKTLNTSRNAVKGLLFRARQVLRRTLPDLVCDT
jgi:RNA polymerase sigma-70 factor (ECF subfamily)